MRFPTLTSILLVGLATTAWADDAKTVNPPPATKLSDFGSFDLRKLVARTAKAPATQLEQHLQAQIKPILAKWKTTAVPNGHLLVIEPEVAEMRFVGKQARGWGGQFAGDSYVVLHLKLTDATTGALVAEPEFFDQTHNGDSKGIADRNMLRHVARAAAEYLKQNHDAAVGGPTGRE